MTRFQPAHLTPGLRGESTAQLLLVDDEPAILQAVARTLRYSSADGRLPRLRIETMTDPQAALDWAAGRSIDLVISDFRMPAMNGAQFLTRLRALQPDCRRVLLSAHTDLQGLADAINAAGIHRFLMKPWEETALAEAVEQQLAERRAALELTLLAEQQRLALGDLTPQEAERRRLERLEPGITHVQWSSDGAYVLDLAGLEENRP